jgi:hydroxyacylglutathione hydrolase
VTHALANGSNSGILGLPMAVVDVPGHTLDHLALLLTENVNGRRQIHLFCGDTLFAGGCGRLFEGSPAQMASSLAKLSALPETTLVYCAHEYTQANLRFAAAVEPENRALRERMAKVGALRAEGKPTLPSSIRLELATNPFLRCGEPAVRAQAILRGAAENSDEVEVFACLRRWKDNF